MFGALIDYWAFTGDDSYNNITKQGLLHQVGDDKDFMPGNQTLGLGNDDQGFWAMASMTAAELNFTNPDANEPQWLALTQAVFNEYVGRWYEYNSTCGGGLQWQIFPQFNAGRNYKNSIANGCFFNIASRLARYTGNDTYAEWADKIFVWMQGVGYITDEWHVYDGAGAAAMYNHTQSDVWKTRVDGLAGALNEVFFQNGIMWEPPCEQTSVGCDTDPLSFKGYLARWMAYTVKLVPILYDTMVPLLNSSARAAALQCDGTSSSFKGHQGTACGFSWLQNETFDGSVGVGQQMNAMSIIYTQLLEDVVTPYTSSTGGSSVGDPNAGASDSAKIPTPKAITSGDRAGAGILTAVIVIGLGGAYGWLMKP
jgi:mannan endo-1,6-alpha-mannosidase